MKKRLTLTTVLPLALIFYLFTSSNNYHDYSTKITTEASSNSQGCHEIITARALSCNCGGGFVLVNSNNEMLLPKYPLPHNLQLEDGQQYRSKYVKEEFEVVIDCFDLGCAAQGYLSDFKCIQKIK